MGTIRIIEIVVENGPLYIKDGPKCYCGNRDWIIKPDHVVCSHCERTRRSKFTGYVVDGPKCYCHNADWFVSNDRWICSHCERSR